MTLDSRPLSTSVALSAPLNPNTVASRLAAMGTAPHVIDAILGHKPPKLIRTYQVYSYEKEMRAALEAWSRNLDRLTSRRE